jgi:DNA-binding NarL/FixJ family response regulator
MLATQKSCNKTNYTIHLRASLAPEEVYSRINRVLPDSAIQIQSENDRNKLGGNVIPLSHIARPSLTNLGLTARQLDLLPLLREGLSNKVIARRLNISHFTVRNHLTTLFKTLGVTNRKALLGKVDSQAD